MVTTHKKETGDVRICIDSRNLNQALMCPHQCAQWRRWPLRCQVPSSSLFWMKKAPFGKLLAASLCTTFTTPCRRFKFLKMPIGNCTVSEVFQRAMEQICAGSPCAIIVIDVIIGGKGPEEHKTNLRKVLDCARWMKLRLNPNKCKFGLKGVSCVGHSRSQSRSKKN